MSPKTHAKARTRRGVHPLIIVLIVALVLALVALVAMRLVDWRGQRVEGTLTSLVNPWNPVDLAGYHPTLTEVEGQQVDQSCAQPLVNLLAACREAGHDPILSVGYISREDLDNGTVSAQETAEAGFSEHEMGLAVDILDAGSGDAAGSGVASWRRENAWQ